MKKTVDELSGCEKPKEQEKYLHLFYSYEKAKIFGSFAYETHGKYMGGCPSLTNGNRIVRSKNKTKPKTKNWEGFTDWRYQGFISRFICGNEVGVKAPNW